MLECDIESIDLITDRNDIRKLLCFVKGTSSEAFQIQVEVVNNKIALFARMQDEMTEAIRSFQGYGHQFEKEYT